MAREGPPGRWYATLGCLATRSIIAEMYGVFSSSSAPQSKHSSGGFQGVCYDGDEKTNRKGKRFEEANR